jgi:peroxiredoxin
MKKIFLTVTFLTICLSVSYCQTSDITKKKITIYLDEYGEKIDGKKFFDLIKESDYSFHPKMENGKVIGLQLKKNEKALHPMSTAPDFSVSDLHGNLYKLSDLKGKIVVLNFWFMACVPCIEEMPELNKLTEKYSNNTDIVFLAITYDSEEKVKSFLSNHDFNYPVAVGQKTLTEQYGIAMYPTNIILDKNGQVAFVLAAYSTDNVKKLDSKISLMTKL